MHKTARTHPNSKPHSPRQWLGYLAVGLGILMHFGTALLRVRAFFPIPALADFSAFYAAASAVRQGLSPYGLSADWLAGLQADRLIPVYPPVIYNPPLWPWLLQPFAALRYPFAAWVWLLCNLGLLIWVALTIYKSVHAGFQNQPGTRAPFRTASPLVRVIFLSAVIITFGPVFLDLSLGQTSVVLLGTVLGDRAAAAQKLDSWKTAIITGLAVALAAVAKLYPALWLVPLALMRRWKQLAVSLVLTPWL